MTTPDAGQRLIDGERVSELLALHKLMEYADAWRTTPGCSCGQCQLCDARELSADDADAIAAILHKSIKTIERLRGVEDDAAKMRAFCRDALHEFWEGDGEMQDMGERHGLLFEVEVKEPCGEACSCAEYGADFPTECYRFAPFLRDAASRSTGAADVGEVRG